MSTIARIQLRRDTAASWFTVNPVLANGEPGVEIDERRIKFGDGITPWNDLPYFVGRGSDANTWPSVLCRFDIRLSAPLTTVTLPWQPVGAVTVAINGLIDAMPPMVAGSVVYLPDDVEAGDDITVLYARTVPS